MFRQPPVKVEIRQSGTNQGVIIKNADDEIHITEFDDKGQKVIHSINSENNLWQNIRNSLKKRNPKVLLTAILLILVSSIVALQYNPKDSFEEKLYKKYYKPVDENIQNLFVENSAFSEAKHKYTIGEHNIALLLLDGIKEQNKTYVDVEVNFYHGLTLMGLDRHEEAINIFSKILNNNNYRSVHAITTWYEGLCYLKLNKLTNAKESFSELLTNNSRKQKEANEILSKIEKHENSN